MTVHPWQWRTIRSDLSPRRTPWSAASDYPYPGFPEQFVYFFHIFLKHKIRVQNCPGIIILSLSLIHYHIHGVSHWVGQRLGHGFGHSHGVTYSVSHAVSHITIAIKLVRSKFLRPNYTFVRVLAFSSHSVYSSYVQSPHGPSSKDDDDFVGYTGYRPYLRIFLLFLLLPSSFRVSVIFFSHP